MRILVRGPKWNGKIDAEIYRGYAIHPAIKDIVDLNMCILKDEGYMITVTKGINKGIGVFEVSSVEDAKKAIDEIIETVGDGELTSKNKELLLPIAGKYTMYDEIRFTENEEIK